MEVPKALLDRRSETATKLETYKRWIAATEGELAALDFAIESITGADSPAPEPNAALEERTTRLPRRDVRGMVLDLVKLQPGLKAGEIASRLDISRSQALAALDHFARTRQLSEGVNGWYSPHIPLVENGSGDEREEVA